MEGMESQTMTDQRPEADDDLTPEQRKERQREEAREAMRAMVPWEGKPSRGDKVLLGSMAAIMVFYLALTPFKPFLIARHPVLLEVVTGNTSATGAAAAFARVGDTSLWLVVLAGVVGAMKFDWLFWLMGRRWGGRIVRMFATTPAMRERVDRAENLPRWVAYVAVLVGVLPGVPTAMAYAFAGWQKMRLSVFLLCNAVSTALWVFLIAGLGYWAGQRAVDIVLLVDKYALWVSLAIIFGMAFVGARRQKA